MDVERNEQGFSVDASLLGELLELPPAEVLALMREKQITAVCENGEGEHAGQDRLTFFYKGRRARLSIDASGRITRRSVIDVGDRPLPPGLRRPGGS